MGSENNNALRRLPLIVIITLVLVSITASAQECSSPTLSFGGSFPVGPEISAYVGAGYTLAQHDVSNVISVSTVNALSPDLPVYIDAVLDNGKLIIKTNQQFTNYEKQEDTLFFLNNIIFICASGSERTLTFRQSIKEENNHAPLFAQETYDVAIPLPLPREFNIQQFIADGKGIVANDYDITNNRITFSIAANDYFTVKTTSGSTRTEFIANLMTKQTLTKIEPPITLQITAVDAGNPPRSSQATLNIKGDPVIAFIPPPEFEQNLYQTVFKIGDNFTPVRINLLPGTYDSTVRFESYGEDVDLFIITPATDSGSATVTLRSGTSIEAEKKLLALTISASRSGTENVGRTALVVELTNEPKIVPTFEASLYNGTIDRNKVIKLDSIKLIPSSSDSGVRVELAGEDARYFTVAFANNQVTLTPSSQLSDAVLKEKNFFLVTVQADKADIGTGEALVVLSVEKSNLKDPHFEQLVYEGTVTESGVLNVPTVRISPDSFIPGLTYSYAGDITLFTINADTSGTITIRSNNITPEKLTDKSYAMLSIVTKLDDDEVAHAVVILKVLRSVVVLPQFTKPFLEGQLIEKTLTVNLPYVELVLESFSTDTVLTVVDDRNFFGILQFNPQNVFRLYLHGNVTRNMLQGIDRLSFTVEASNPKSEKVYCVVTVDIVRTPVPAFERLIYDGVIDESKQLVEEMVAKLTAESTDANILYTLDGEDASFFLLETITNGVRIQLKRPLSDDEFDSRDHFQLSLKATNPQLPADTVVPVIVYVTHSLMKIPRFEKPLYKSRIDVNLKLVPFEQIIVERGSFVDEATVAIRNSNSELFDVKLQQGIVTVQLVKELDQTAVNGVSRFEFVVECTNPGQASGFTTILVDIDRVIVPEFPDLFYTGEIQENSKSITFNRKVALSPQTIVNNTEYKVEGQDSALVAYLILDDQSLSFFLRDEVSKEQLKARSEISFIVVATNPGANQRAIVPCSVKIIREIKPTFTSTSFHGKIVEETTTVNFGTVPIAWESGSIKETTTFTIVDAIPNDFFDVKLTEDRNTVEILLKSEVKWDQVRSSVYYQLQLQAVNPGSETAQCTIVIDVENFPAITPTFTKSIYRGSLQEGTKEVMFSAADTITVQPETIMSTFQYAATPEGDANLFDVVLVDDNKFKVSLKDGIEPSTIEGRDMLSFILTINNAYSADDAATIVITIKLDDIIIPTFSKLLYNGSIVEGTNDLSLQETILLTTGTFTDNTELGIGGTDAALFTISRDGSAIDLKIRDESINWGELVSKHYLSVYVQATNPGSETSTSFVVVEIEQLRQPQFVQSSAHGYIAAGEREVQFLEGSELRIVTDSTEPGYQWNLVGDDYQLFDGSLADDLFKFTLKESIADEQQSRTVFKFRVTLKNPTGNEADSIVVVNRQLSVPQFSKNIYTGSFDKDLRLSLVDTIELTQASYTNGILVSMIESNVDFLSLEQTGRSIQLKLSRLLSISDFQGLDMVRLVLSAKASNDIWSTCSVTLSVPEGTPCIPLPPVVDCTSCYNCTTGGVQEDVPVFAYGNFRFQLRSDTTGPIGSVTATVKDPTAVVQHNIDVEDAYLKSQLSITPEGLLLIANPIIPNVYQFLVHATNTAAGKKATANVWLDVLNRFECTEGDKQSTVDQVLIVQHLEEERPYASILSTQLNPSCSYELISEYPTDNQQPYFYIDLETKWLASRSFDRENEDLFEGMQIPQFKLVMKLKCLETDEPHEQDRRSLVKRSLIETDTINYASDITIVSIVVDDINDNDPVFVEPTIVSGNAVQLGFPEPSLANRLMLSGLIAVKATDVDEGLNGKVRYSLSENVHFMINPETGSIEPTKDALRDSSRIDLIAFATDRDGALDGRMTQLGLAVHRLNENHIAFVTITAADEATVREIIEQVNIQRDFHLKVLRQSYIPETEAASVRVNRRPTATRDIESSISNMRLIVYALNDNNQLLNTDDIRNAIRIVFPNIATTAITSFNDAVCYGNTTDPSCPSTPNCPEELTGRSSNGGLIASTSVLGGLLLISLTIITVLYLRYVRPLSKGTDSNPSDIVQLENDFDATPPPSPATSGGKKDPIADPPMIEDRKISINIVGITMQESEDTNTDNNRLARSLTDRLDEEDEYGATIFGTSGQDTFSEPKNVKFNEIVERIEVEEHHSDEDNDESVYEERL